MLLLDSEALSALAHGPASRRDRVRALIVQMRRRELPIATMAAVLAEVARGRAADAGVFAGLRHERVMVHPVDTQVGVRAGHLLGRMSTGYPPQTIVFESTIWLGSSSQTDWPPGPTDTPNRS